MPILLQTFRIRIATSRYTTQLAAPFVPVSMLNFVQRKPEPRMRRGELADLIGLAGLKDWQLKAAILEADWTFITNNSVDFRGPEKKPGSQGIYAGIALHAELICIDAPGGLNLGRQTSLFQLILSNLQEHGDLTNQVLQVLIVNGSWIAGRGNWGSMAGMRIPLPYVWPICLIGLGIFSIGAMASMYMQAKTGRLIGWRQQYKKLVVENGDSPWPIRIMGICTPLGVFVAFAAILLSH